MTLPNWLPATFAAIMSAVAAGSAARLITAYRRRTGVDGCDVDAAHLLMGIAMTRVLTGGTALLPQVAWQLLFGGITAWFAWRLYRQVRHGRGADLVAGGHYAQHLAHAAGMLYMSVSLSAPLTQPATARTAGILGMAAAAGARRMSTPAVAAGFALLMIGFVVWDLDRLSTGLSVSAATRQAGRHGRRNGVGGWFLHGPALAMVFEVAMSATMGWMLIVMM